MNAIDTGVSALLTADEATQHLGIPERTLDILRAVGVGPRSFMLGRRRVYRTQDLDDWRACLNLKRDLALTIECVTSALFEVAETFDVVLS